MKVVHLVFFDIDGTILHMNGAGRMAFVRALQKVLGWKDGIEYIKFAGATDLQVLVTIAGRHQHRLTDAEREHFFDAMTVELEQAVTEVEPLLFPGVTNLIEQLAARDDYLVGLITGNEERCARIKLNRFDLHGHFMLGAFGHEHADRIEIARLALRRAEEQLHPSARPGNIFLIGDTPNDLAAARAIGGRSIAVATGGFDAYALRQAGADYVLEDLGDGQAVAAILGLDV